MIRLKGEPHLVVGVAPLGFVSGNPADVWAPLRPSRQGEGEGVNYQIVVRTQGDLSLLESETATALLLEEIFDRRLRQDASGREIVAHLRLLPLQEGLTRQQEQPLVLLWVAVAVVLLIGRLESRSRELALRQSLGGGRAAVARQLLTESVILALCGGTAGVVIGYGSLVALRGLLREGFAIWQPIDLDLRALAVTAIVPIGCGLVFGFYPAWRGSRSDLRSVLDQGDRGASRRGVSWSRGLLVVAQLSACLLLLAGAGLTIRTFDALRSLEPGFDPRGVVVAAVSLDDARYASAKSASRLFEAVLSRVRETPGVVAAGVGHTLPYERAINLGFRVAGEENSRITDVVYVVEGYFEALGIPLLRSRRLRRSDQEETEPVVLINRAFVERYLEGRDELTTSLSLGGTQRQVVGVVGDVQHRPGWNRGVGPLSPMATVYIPVSQLEDQALSLLNTWSMPSFVVRSSRSSLAVTASIREAVGSVDPLLPFAEIRTMEGVQGQAWARQRVQATLLAALEALALTLAAVGIYGLLASLVAERTREAAIRIALGASSWQMVRAIAVSGLFLAMVGVGIGLLLVPAAGRSLEGMIWGVEPVDPITLAVGAGALILTAVFASVGSAMRLLRIEPAALLREE